MATGQDWIIDVLSDLRRFAHENALPILAAQLEHTAMVAEAEIAPAGKGTERGIYRAAGTRSVPREARTS